MRGRFTRRVEEMYMVYRRLDRIPRVLAWLGFWGGAAMSYFGIGLIPLVLTLVWLYRLSKENEEPRSHETISGFG